MATPLALLIEAQFVMVGFLDIPKGTLPEHYWPAILPLRFLLVNILTWILLLSSSCSPSGSPPARPPRWSRPRRCGMTDNI